SNRYTAFTTLRLLTEKLRSTGMRCFDCEDFARTISVPEGGFWMRSRRYMVFALAIVGFLSATAAVSLPPQAVSFLPYIEPGDNGPFGPKDKMVVTWQTNEVAPVTSAYSVQFGTSLASPQSAVVSARVVDNYLAADPQFSSLTLP